MDKVIMEFEGFKKSVYKDTNNIKTVGVGFNMDQAGAKQVFEKYVPGVSFDDVYSGRTSLTKPQVESLFQGTLNDKIRETKGLFKHYEDYPYKVQTALVNAVFRGEMKASDKTVRLINNNDWSKVVEEYLDRNDYREASKPGSNCRGVKERMDYNAKIFEEYAKMKKDEKR